jgi:hypothetical protein
LTGLRRKPSGSFLAVSGTIHLMHHCRCFAHSCLDMKTSGAVQKTFIARLSASWPTPNCCAVQHDSEYGARSKCHNRYYMARKVASCSDGTRAASSLPRQFRTRVPCGEPTCSHSQIPYSRTATARNAASVVGPASVILISASMISSLVFELNCLFHEPSIAAGQCNDCVGLSRLALRHKAQTRRAERPAGYSRRRHR